jgi:hypothetical protein
VSVGLRSVTRTVPEKGFREHTMRVLERVLDGLSQRGLRCITLSEAAERAAAAADAAADAPAASPSRRSRRSSRGRMSTVEVDGWI